MFFLHIWFGKALIVIFIYLFIYYCLRTHNLFFTIC